MALNYEYPVDVMKKVDPVVFREKYLKTDTPVVLKGLWDHFPATKKWTIDFFKEELGDYEVGVFDEGKPDRSFKRPDHYMKFRDYLDLISKGPTNYRLFLFDILKLKPELKKDFDFPPITKRYLKRLPFMFFGGKDAVVRIHQDMDWSNVFLTQLYGRKQVILFHPKYSDLLYRFPYNVHSSVNVENPDYKMYPGLKYVRGMRCILEPGDTLFIPGGYWHYIKYLDGGYAINQRALSPFNQKVLKGIWYVVFLSNFDDLMRKISGKKWFDYKRRISFERAGYSIQQIEQVGTIATNI